jgi:hypothetical protein
MVRSEGGVDVRWVGGDEHQMTPIFLDSPAGIGDSALASRVHYHNWIRFTDLL